MLPASCAAHPLGNRLLAPTVRRRPRSPQRKNAHRDLSRTERPASVKTCLQVPAVSGESAGVSTISRRTPLLPQGNQSIPEVTVSASKLSQFWECTKAQYGFGDGSTQPGLDAYQFASDLASDIGLPSLPSAANWVVTSTGIGRIVSEVGALPVPKRLVGLPIFGGPEVSRVTNVLNYSSYLLGLS